MRSVLGEHEQHYFDALHASRHVQQVPQSH